MNLWSWTRTVCCSFWHCARPHVCGDVIPASPPDLALTSNSCLVLWPCVCSPFRHSLIRDLRRFLHVRLLRQKKKEPCLPRNFAALYLSLSPPLRPSRSLFYTLGFSRVSDTLTLQTVVGSGRTKTCRWRLYAHSDTQRQRVPLAPQRWTRGAGMFGGIHWKHSWDTQGTVNLWETSLVTGLQMEGLSNEFRWINLEGWNSAVIDLDFSLKIFYFSKSGNS